VNVNEIFSPRRLPRFPGVLCKPRAEGSLSPRIRRNVQRQKLACSGICTPETAQASVQPTIQG
jgi:hypothetical protein